MKYPYPEGVRLDSIVESGSKISYYYQQDVKTDDNSKKFLITLNGKVVALDGSSYRLPESDTLVYHISSMLNFVDTTTRYVTRVIEKYVVVNDRNYLSFHVNDSRIIDTLGDNHNQLERIEGLMNTLINQHEFYVDSILMTASASPEGTYLRNNILARDRAFSLRKHLADKFGSRVESLITVRWLAEDWDKLKEMIDGDESIAARRDILELMAKIANPDKRELEIRAKFPQEYSYILEKLYPKLRAVNFKYDLRRVGMVKDTIHTTEPDTLYARGVDLLNSRKYSEALAILEDYKDRNSAIVMMSLGYDQSAYEVLCSLPETAITTYLKAIVCSRLERYQQGRECFLKACSLDGQMEHRGKLDPEISVLLKKE